MLGRVVVYLLRHRGRLLAGTTFTFLGIGFELLKPVPLAIVLDVVLGGQPLPALVRPWLGGMAGGTLLLGAAVAIVLLTLAHGALTVAANYLTIDVGQRMVNDLRTDLYAHLQKLSMKFHYEQQVGDLLFRVMADTFSIQGMVMNGLLPLFSATLMLVSMFAVMASYDASMALVSALVAPPLYLAISRLSSRIHGHAAASKEAESALYSRAETAIGAVKLVQAYGRERDTLAEFRAGSERSLQLTLKLYSTETIFMLIVDGVLACGTALLVYIGATRVMAGQLSIGALTIFLAYLKNMYTPIQSVAQNLKELASARAGLDRVFQVLDVEPDVRDRPGARPLENVRGTIRLEGVGFGYSAERPVLNDVTLEIAAGQKVALVGKTGAGKSTLASLVLRFFDPQLGRVTLDGYDLRELQVASLRQNVTLMLQEPILFHSSVADNIRFARPAATLAEIQTAARRAEAEPFIRELPQGYDTVLGQDGLTLSGGQRQRLALARALLRESQIVILDEPTSALDVVTESVVWKNVEELLRGKTAILIAHRLSTARMADRIVVMGDGRILEQGTHDELLALRGAYADLWSRSNTGRELIEAVV